MRWLNVLAAVVPLVTTTQATLQIVPGATWTATNNGKHIQAHGGGILKMNGIYYWVGEDKTDGTAFQRINCYSSSNLVEWSYVGALLSRTSSGDLGPNRIVERPKIVYNKSTKKYVLWMHIDNSSYSEAKAGVATSDTVCGTYTYRGSVNPLGFQSRDMGVFIDDDDKGYLLTEDRQNGLRIDLLSDDYLSVKSSTYVWAEKIESPALIKKNGMYYMFGSHLTGWDANDNVYSTATKLSGPWSSWNTFARVGSKTYQSQTSFVLPVGDNFMYMGDRWVSSNLMASTYIWLPLRIDGKNVTMDDMVNWVVDASSGSMTSGPSENQYEGESSSYSGGAKTISCAKCSGAKAAGYIGGTDNGEITFSNVQSSATTRTTIRVKYLNGDSSQRFANVTVNGGTMQQVAFIPASGDPGSSTLNTDLKQGANTIKISGIGGGSWGPDVDRLMVPQS